MSDDEQIASLIADLRHDLSAQHVAILDLSDAMLEMSAGAMRSNDPEMQKRGRKAFDAVGRVLRILDHDTPGELL